MTENKRFTMCHEQNDINGWTMSIVDWQTKEPFNYTTYEVHSSSITDTEDEMEDLCLLLNELNDENEQLRKENDMFSCELSVSANKEISRNCRIVELEEENEQYKSLFFELVETALTDKNCRELYCKGILDIFNKANSLNQAREMIKEHLE